MTRYILQRLALLPLLMVIYSFVIFVIIQAPPGDFLTAYVATLASSGSSLSAEQIAAMRTQYGLDQPFVVQYLLWLQHLFHGDFGLSLEYQRPNADLIGEHARSHARAGAVLLRADLGARRFRPASTRRPIRARSATTC